MENIPRKIEDIKAFVLGGLSDYTPYKKLLHEDLVKESGYLFIEFSPDKSNVALKIV